MKNFRKQSGLSLIELMVSLVVFSVGVVGVAALLLTSMRDNDATLMRSQSSMLATELYEAMLANMGAVELGDYNLLMSGAIPTTFVVDCGTASATCTASQMAAYDMGIWGARVRRVLASADAAVAVDTSVDPLLITVQVRFKSLREVAGRTTETYTFRARNEGA